ncbi:GntR family transcriptional regulator YhfZ [Yersinia bercovieri]|uniref:GntR family transcriptional regulator YhfZ n=1 Tax=Yersinia TaxID=629 RepID=UPI00110F4E82|nr:MULTISPECIES: GntR family transcriptional regulator YhfZ [Yersinia]MCB5302681.1 GntR family transcriptional regulator [Yersinia bercovieri]QDW32581.1 GntR family transcriptional regulator [Yersinia sp. KBS0713]
MSKKFIKKEGLALVSMARYLIGERPGNRLKTIDELSEDFGISVGVVQHALKVLEADGAIIVERRGRNGTLLVDLNMALLLQQADLGNMVCAMPLPYTKLYEGLASGLREQFTLLPLYFAHMRGAEVRIECLIDGIYDMAVVSHLAAKSYLAQGRVAMALNLGNGSYVDGHQLICRRGEQHNIRRVGLDPRSPDQCLLTEIKFAGQAIELVELPYSDCIVHINRGDIDAAIWNLADDVPHDHLQAIKLQGDERYIQASQAVILIRPDNHPIKLLLEKGINETLLLNHQRAVQKGEIEPRY